MEFNEKWLYRLALKLIPGIGDKLYKVLIANCGSAREVFRERPVLLARIPGIGPKSIKGFSSASALQRAEEELRFMERNLVRAWFYLDSDYPERLKWCDDGPAILFYKGSLKPNRNPMLAVVGTRSATAYGREFCDRFIGDLRAYDPVIVSGLAYGIDISAHRAAMHNNLATLAVLGHGLDRIYPFMHRRDARNMQEKGAIITEFMSGVLPDRENFPKRNRIVAGMCDAVVVVEAAKRGGALITAEIANSYNREVFAVPGRLGDKYAEGCNFLIKTNKASLLSGVRDLEYLLNWQKKSTGGSQQKLFLELPPSEDELYQFLRGQREAMPLSAICSGLGKPVSKVLQLLMSLELKNLARSLPGQMYTIN